MTSPTDEHAEPRRRSGQRKAIVTTEKPLVCPHCGHTLLALQTTLRRYETQIEKLEQRLLAEKPRGRDLVAHKNGELFHRATCKWARPIPRTSRVKFSSRDDAIKAGFRRCDACNS